MLFYSIIAIDFILSLIVGALMIRMILYVSYKGRLFDIPDGRKVHKIPVPRLAGVSFMPTLMIVIAFSFGIVYRSHLMSAPEPDGVLLIRLSFMLGSAMLLYVVGILDDLTDLNYKIKFGVQFVASALLVSSGLWLNNFYGLFGIWRIPFYIAPADADYQCNQFDRRYRRLGIGTGHNNAGAVDLRLPEGKTIRLFHSVGLDARNGALILVLQYVRDAGKEE